MQDHGENPEADMCVFPPKQPPDSDVPEDVAGEFSTPLALSRPRDGPRVINVGIPGTNIDQHIDQNSQLLILVDQQLILLPFLDKVTE